MSSPGRLSLPVGAELAVAEHLQDLLLTDEGRGLLEAAAASGDADETAALAQWLAEALIHGVEVDVVEDTRSRERRTR